jgi:CubicO group peptidase (beta-lactamase class C family)
MIKGYCNPNFQKVHDAFSNVIASGFETGAALSNRASGVKWLFNLWGGHQDANKTKAWEENTLVNVFSVTKGVTATCISKLIDQKQLDPNKNVSHYWPEYSCNGKEATRVSDLLCHRAAMFGFKDGIPAGSFQDWEKFTKKLQMQAPYRKPGISQGYHALTFGWLVGELIRRVDGRSVGKIL